MYQRNLLRINLSEQTAKEEEIDPRLIRDYVGGRGLGARLLYDEVPPNTDPLGDENKLIFSHSGPAPQMTTSRQLLQQINYVMTLAWIA